MSADDCPCGSGRSFGDCCLGGDARPRPRPAPLQPPRPPSGHRHPRCYLASSADCSAKLSREHYISRTLISDPGLKVWGFPWQPTEYFHCSPDALTAKILCQRHNSALAPLDAEVGRTFRALGAAIEHASRRSLATRPAYFLISGTALELWAMKTLAGLYASGMEFYLGEHRFRDYPPPMDAIAQALTGDRPASIMTMTISTDFELHERALGRSAVSTGPILDPEAGVLRGMLLRLRGLGMSFWFKGHEAWRANERERPDMIDFNGPHRTARVYLGWEQAKADGLLVTIDMRQAAGRARGGGAKRIGKARGLT